MQTLEKGLINSILNTDALTGLKQIPDNFVDCCITSPPYWSLRKYGVPALWDADPNCEHEWTHRLDKWHGDRGDIYNKRKEVFDDTFQVQGTHSDFCSKCGAWQGELGLEPTFQLYIEHLLQIFDQVKRVLKKEGACWVVISDTYSAKPVGSFNGGGAAVKSPTREFSMKTSGIMDKTGQGIPEKSLLMIPERFAIGMIDHGWILRNKVIWHKRNCMPSSAKDRFTVDYENVYFFVKSRKYYFNTQYEPYETHEKRPMGVTRSREWGYLSKYANTPYYGKGKKQYEENNVQNPSDVKRRILASMNRNNRVFGGAKYGGVHMKDKKPFCPIGGVKKAGGDNPTYSGKAWNPQLVGRIKRAVWTINTKPFSEAHFAVFPETLVQTPISSTCPAYICDNCGEAWLMEYSEKRVNTRPGNDVLNAKSGTDSDPNAGLHKSDLSKYRQQIIRNIKGYIVCGCNVQTHGGIVLDPFMGSGTAALVALKMNRNFIGIEPKKEYVDMAYKRIDKYLNQTKLQ